MSAERNSLCLSIRRALAHLERLNYGHAEGELREALAMVSRGKDEEARRQRGVQA